jgi:thermitase
MGTLQDFTIGALGGGCYLLLRRGQAFILLGPAVLAALLWTFLAIVGWGISWVQDRTGEQAPAVYTGLMELGPDDKLAEVQPILDRYQAQAARAFPSISLQADEDLAQYFVLRCNKQHRKDLLRELRADRENVDQIGKNSAVRAVPVRKPRPHQPARRREQPLANDPLFREQWALPTPMANRVYKLLERHPPEQPARLAILDTGVDPDHEDLADSYQPGTGNRDGNGHGTHCAGLAAAVTNNGKGIASFNWRGRYVKVSGYRALNAQGRGTILTLARAIIQAAQAGADVISLSLGSFQPTPPKAEADAIAYAQRKGCLVVAAAGNANQSASNFAPANLPGVFTVTALNTSGQKAFFSNTVQGFERPVAAPGVRLLSLAPDNGYKRLSGTSMATPYVAGFLAVLRSVRPNLSASEAYKVLRTTGRKTDQADRIGPSLRPDRALQRLLGASLP